jgi:hypothetical protein
VCKRIPDRPHTRRHPDMPCDPSAGTYISPRDPGFCEEDTPLEGVHWLKSIIRVSKQTSDPRRKSCIPDTRVWMEDDPGLSCAEWLSSGSLSPGRRIRCTRGLLAESTRKSLINPKPDEISYLSSGPDSISFRRITAPVEEMREHSPAADRVEMGVTAKGPVPECPVQRIGDTKTPGKPVRIAGVRGEPYI